MPRLCVNIDHVATVREARKITEPDPIHAAALAERAGAAGITLHLREDRRHVNDTDLRRLRESVTTFLNLEMALTPEMIAIAIATRPEMVTLVPESRAEITTEGGLDAVTLAPRLREAIAQLHAANIRVSLFVDPDAPQITASQDVAADIVELHTGPYANATTRGAGILPAYSADPNADTANLDAQSAELQRLVAAAELAHQKGLIINAGHGLNLRNVAPIAAIKNMRDLHIGHSIIAHSIYVGIEQATREMDTAINEGHRLGETQTPESILRGAC